MGKQNEWWFILLPLSFTSGGEMLTIVKWRLEVLLGGDFNLDAVLLRVPYFGRSNKSFYLDHRWIERISPCIHCWTLYRV